MSSLTFTRDGVAVTATPMPEGDPILTGDDQFASELRAAFHDSNEGSWLPPMDEDAPVFNLCAAAQACGADRVSTAADDDVPFPFDLLGRVG